LGLSARPLGGGVLSPAAVRRTGTASEARAQGRTQSVAEGDAERSGAPLNVSEAVLSQGLAGPARRASAISSGLRGLERSARQDAVARAPEAG